MSASSFRVAAVQTVSGGDVAANLATIEPLVADAARLGAKLVLLPEYFGVFGDTAHETEESLLLERLDVDQAVAGTDVLVQTDHQRFGGGLFAILCGCH